jgi:hypothetical protein
VGCKPFASHDVFAVAFLVVIPEGNLFWHLNCSAFLGPSPFRMNRLLPTAYYRKNPMKKHTKIILAVSLALIAFAAIDYQLREQRIATKERKTYDDKLAFYGLFLKQGMMRADVETELRQRLIPFESYGLGTGHTDDFVLLERFESPQWYCSFEDALMRFEFDPESGLLRKTSVYHQLKDCL